MIIKNDVKKWKLRGTDRFGFEVKREDGKIYWSEKRPDWPFPGFPLWVDIAQLQLMQEEKPTTQHFEEAPL